jgi:carboxyl-terminal processing protease
MVGTFSKGMVQMTRSKLSLRIAAVAIAALSAAAFATTVAAQPAAKPAAQHAPTALDRGRLFDVVIERIQARFWEPEQLKTERFAEQAAARRQAVIDAPSDDAAVALINGLIETTKASHFRLYTPDELGYYILLDILPNASGAHDLAARKFWGARPYYAGIGAFTADIGGKHFIDGIMDGSPAERAGLRIGDEIVDVDGAPYHQIRAFNGKLGATVRIGVRRTVEGPVESIALPVMPIIPNLGFEQATEASARVIQHGNKRIGYIRIWSFTSTTPVINAMSRLTPGGRLTRFETSAERTSSTTFSSPLGGLISEPLDGMIIDTRGKIGGSDISDTILALLDGSFASRRRGAPFVFRAPRQQQRNTVTPVQNPSFQGKTVLLTDHHTRSAGELVSYSFRYAKMGEIVGTNTVGHVLAAGIDVVPGDLVLQIPQSRPEVGGVALEGKGVAPDITVERPLPYSGGADPVLDAGLKRLAEMLAR